jgi:hypothetical protein
MGYRFVVKKGTGLHRPDVAIHCKANNSSSHQLNPDRRLRSIQ